MEEKIKRKYFHRRKLLTVVFGVVWGFSMAIAFLYKNGLFIALGILLISIAFLITLFSILEKKYRKVEMDVKSILVSTVVIFAIFGGTMLYLAVSKMISLPIWVELFLGNFLILLLVVISYITPGVKKSLKRAKELPEDLKLRVNNLKREMGVEKAEVYLFEGEKSKIANAMQIGGKGKYVFVSSYLLKNMSENELLAIIAHELAHIKFRHVLKISILVYVAFLFILNLYILLPLLKLSSDLLSLYRLLALWIPILFIIIGVPFIRRRFERQADMEAAHYMGKDNMISALNKLSDLAFLPKKVSKFWNLSHPSIEDRVRYLKEKY